MATATRKLFVNWATKTLQISDTNGGVFTLPNFAKYEVIPFEVVIVEPDLSAVGLPRWQRVDISNLSLAIAFNDTLDDLTPLAYQNTFDKNEVTNVFSGSLNLNTSGFNTWLDADSKSGYFEIEIQEGSNVSKILRVSVTAIKSVVQVGSAVPSPVDEYFTKEQVKSQFVQFVMAPGQQLTITSPGNVYQRILGIDDGGNLIDQVVPV
jgi:hypothetical protein